ncbi:MAG: putative ABC transport system ATP-binding protein [Planctomycetota bacterium]|jgi:putative ABC transport system ATP-binding protein
MGKKVLELEQVVKTYGSGDRALTVLHGLDIAVEEGEFVGIVGTSGSGKTTLMNIVGCLDHPTSGGYRLNGEDVARLDDDSLSAVRNRSIGFVFQSFNLIAQMTVLENVELPLFYSHTARSERHDRCIELIEAVGLGHRTGHYPTQLSGGECQRVAIARALVNRPALLLTDEPTGNLDTKNGEEVLKIFHDLHAKGRTILMVTHNPEIAAGLPRVIEMRDGRVLKDSGVGSGLVLKQMPTAVDDKPEVDGTAAVDGTPAVTGEKT